MAWHAFSVAYSPIVADISKWSVAVLKTKPPLVEGMGPRMETFVTGQAPFLFQMSAGSDQGMFQDNVVAFQCDLPEADDECYVAVFHRNDGVNDWIMSPPFHNISGNKSVVPSILGTTPAGGTPGSCRIVDNMDYLQNIYLTHTATSFASSSGEMMFWVMTITAQVKLYFITANLPIPSSWMVSMNNAKSFVHTVGGIHVYSDDEMHQMIVNKLDAISLQIGSGSGGSSDTEIILTAITDEGIKIRNNASNIADDADTHLEAVYTGLAAKVDGIQGMPQNVIDMIMDMHAEAMGSWSWDKRTGILTMFDTHGLEAAKFSVTDTADLASRERRADLEAN